MGGEEMIFASYEFIFLFLPIVIFTYFMIGKKVSLRCQHMVLVLASLFFYGYFNVAYLWIILVSIGANYLLALAIQKKTQYQKLFYVNTVLY